MSGPSVAPLDVPGWARTVDVHPIIVKSDTTPIDSATHDLLNRRIEVMKSVWGKLGVSFAVKPAIELVMPEAVNRDAVDPAARVDIDGVWKRWDGTGVGVFVVEDSLAWTGGGKTYTFKNNGKVIITAGGLSDTLLAHELGHALGLQHPPDGADSNTVMDPTDDADKFNPTRNTIGNYRRIVWPLPEKSTTLSPDP